MKSILIIITCLLISNFTFAQESNNGKKIWAKSVLNQKAPALKVAEWLSSKPETKGKFILIDFWGTWCGPCREAIPELNKIHKQFKNDLVVIGISKETADQVRAMKEPKIDYFYGVDPQATMSKELEIGGIPHVLLIDPEGIVRWEGFPLLKDHELTPKVVKTLIQKYK